jgi:hypothetical protein
MDDARRGNDQQARFSRTTAARCPRRRRDTPWRVAGTILPYGTSARAKAAPITREKAMKKHRLGAWIGQEAYVDKRTGERKTCATWTVRYKISKSGEPRRQKKVAGFESYDDAAAWWLVQKKNPQRDVPVAEVVRPAPQTVGAYLEKWLLRCRGTLAAGPSTAMKIMCGFTCDRSLGRCCCATSPPITLKL